MNIEEAIKYFEDKRKDYVVPPSVITVSTSKVINILKQIKLDKLMPEIPQFVADYIDDMHKNARTLRYAFKYMESNIKMHKWCVFERQETFVNAFLYGYVVEKEKLYTVEIPNPYDKQIALRLEKWVDGKVRIVTTHSTNNFTKDMYLTEQEICKDFDWAWQFREEVTNEHRRG
ncbi:DUF1642 domain-containing protein [Streptococcus agalactiae]|uniref:DUF1642 domain-containing protein n=1 Tax=Streptococcus agalactiae TaxID=1311 RepID=UPI0039C62770